MNSSSLATIPDALLFITPGCPHCPVVLQGLSELVKQGLIGSLEVVNAALRPERAAELGIRTAPWTRIGPFILEGSQSPAELKKWAKLAGSEGGVGEYLKQLLTEGNLAIAERFISDNPHSLATTLPLIEDPELPIQVRLGIGALFEGQPGSEPLKSLVAELGRLSRHEDHRVRCDACHFLGLSRSRVAIPILQERLKDDHPEVREIAEEALREAGAAAD
jgi:hypothetical protein